MAIGRLMWMSGAPGRGRALGAGELKLLDITPGLIWCYHVDIKRLMNRQVALAIADGTMAVDGETVYEVKGMKVATYISTEDE